MSTSPMTFDMALETEEFVTAEEFLRRRERGEINPAEVRYVFDQPGEPFGGFRIKLKQPRYKVNIPQNEHSGGII